MRGAWDNHVLPMQMRAPPIPGGAFVVLLAQLRMNSSRSLLSWSLWVSVMPCGAPMSNPEGSGPVLHHHFHPSNPDNLLDPSLLPPESLQASVFRRKGTRVGRRPLPAEVLCI